jgi:hypothetical protein
VAECAGAPLPPGSSRDQARGFQGVSLQDVTSVQPQNTPRGGELTPPETGYGTTSWKHVVACITFAYSTDPSIMPYDTY